MYCSHPIINCSERKIYLHVAQLYKVGEGKTEKISPNNILYIMQKEFLHITSTDMKVEVAGDQIVYMYTFTMKPPPLTTTSEEQSHAIKRPIAIE